jgi:glucokinase
MNNDPQTQYAIGIDIGGTKIAGGVVASDSGAILLRETIPTDARRGGERVLADVTALIERLHTAATAQQIAISGVGLGLCELVGPAGNVTSAYNFDWRNLPVRVRCSQLIPAILESDVRAAARGEAIYGAGRGCDLFAYITVGTGISSAIVQQGRPLTGARGNALVLASMPLTATCPNCGATVNPILEEFAGGPALIRRYNQQAATTVSSGQELFARVAQGDTIAQEVVRSGGEALGVSVAFLCNVLDPEVIIVGGGLGTAGGLYWASFVEATRRHIYAEDTRTLPIVPAELGVDAGIIGAAAAVW